MVGVNTSESKSRLMNLLVNPKFQIHLAMFRGKWSIPMDGFANYQEYKEWVLRYQGHSDSIQYGFDRIVKRCNGLYSKNDPVFPLLLGLYVLFNKFPDSYPADEHLPKSISIINSSGLLGYIDITLRLPWNFAFQDVIDAARNSEGLIEGVSRLVSDSLGMIKASADEPFDSLDDDVFLDTTPGNPADIVARNQEDLEWLIEFGQVLLRESVTRMQTHEVTSYQDKNKHIGQGIQQIGMFLNSRRLYYAAEIFWIGITEETNRINQEKGIQLNRGVSFGNTGVYQIIQGKTKEGLFNLYRAFEDDRKVLEKLNDPNSNPELNLVSTPLYTQFEDSLIEWFTGQLLGPYLDLVGTFPRVDEIKQYIQSLDSGKRLHLFGCLISLRDAIEQERILTNFISRGNMLTAIGDLCRWIEDSLKRKNSAITKLSQAYSFINSQQINTGSSSLTELVTKITEAETNRSCVEANALASVYIRNYSSHNFESTSHQFYVDAERYVARIFFSIVSLAREGKI